MTAIQDYFCTLLYIVLVIPRMHNTHIGPLRLRGQVGRMLQCLRQRTRDLHHGVCTGKFLDIPSKVKGQCLLRQILRRRCFAGQFIDNAVVSHADIKRQRRLVRIFIVGFLNKDFSGGIIGKQIDRACNGIAFRYRRLTFTDIHMSEICHILRISRDLTLRHIFRHKIVNARITA